jgi:hypothetical protein
VDITESTVSSILKAQIPLIKDYSMNSNFNDLFTLTDYESDTSNTGDVSKLLALNTQTSSNEGVSIEMEALGLGGEVLDAVVKPSVNEVKEDLTDWAKAIR